jgi:DUF4097 and DUF4098 domain-containing protein YvlB
MPALAGEIIDETRDVDPNEVVDIELINGHITIIGWDRNQIQIKGELSDQAETYDFTSRNGITRFEEEYENRRDWLGINCTSWFSCSGDYDKTELEVFLPENSTLRFEGINAELEISNMAGNTQIEIINGPVVASSLTGRINIETVNGPIETNNLDGRITLSTVNGQIRDRDSIGERVNFSTVNGSIISNSSSERVDADSVSGSVELDLGIIDDLEASSVSGSLIVSLELLEGGKVELSNVSGYTELLINENASARFDLNTAVGGDIDNDLSDHEARQENRFVNSSELQFSLNGGSGNVDISTVTGDILIGKK